MWNKRTEEPPEGAVYVGPESEWENPFETGGDGDREDAVDRYRAWLGNQPDLIQRIREELAGKDLVCWCAPEPCHGDVLLEVANGGDEVVLDVRLGLSDDLRERRDLRTCPYCDQWFHSMDLLRDHVRRANRTGYCLGDGPPRDEGGTF